MSDKNFVSYGDAETVLSGYADAIKDAKKSKGYVQIGAKTGTTPNATATVEGTENTASGTSAHAEGYKVVASGAHSHAEGYSNTVSGSRSHVGGGRDFAFNDSGGYSTTITGENVVTGDNDLVYGTANKVSGENNVVFGSRNSDGVGVSNTLITGDINTVTKGYHGIVGGNNNEIDDLDSSLVIGRFNDINQASDGSIIGGAYNTVNEHSYSNNSLLLGRNNEISGDIDSSILSGKYNNIKAALGRSLITGQYNEIGSEDHANVNNIAVFGHTNTVKGNLHNLLINGELNTMNSGWSSANNIISGNNNTINSDLIESSTVLGSSIISDKNSTIHKTLITGYGHRISGYVEHSLITGNWNVIESSSIIEDSIVNGGQMDISGSIEHCIVAAAPYSYMKSGEFFDGCIISGIIDTRDISITTQANDAILSGSHPIGRGKAFAVFGSWNNWVSDTNVDYNVQPSNNILEVGKGNYNGRANAFRVAATGVYASGSYNASGADYAEMFQWKDNNTENEDRRGLFVSLDGDRLVLAESDEDFILGIVSGNPSIVGDVYDDQWNGMYETDIFGTPVWEEVYHEETEIDEEYMEDDEKGKPVKKYRKVTIPAHTERKQKLNPNYDKTTTYISRSDRPEWSAVGLMGKLVLTDDGTSEVNGWIKPSKGGVGTKSETRTKYRVMERLDENHVRILILP